MGVFRKVNGMYVPTIGSVVHEELPAGTYTIMANESRGVFCAETPTIDVPDKIYGDVDKYVKRIINTYTSRNKNTGVLCSGTAGSGKTVLGKLLAIEAINKLNMPVIIIDSPIPPGAIKYMLSKLGSKRVMIFFDEFEKMYNTSSQAYLLTLLDGTMNTNILTLITCNDEEMIHPRIKDRPGRSIYHFRYSGLSESTILEYLKEHLENKEYIQDILTIRVGTTTEFTMDILRTLVEECNTYSESPFKFLKFFNLTPLQAMQKFSVTMECDDSHREVFFEGDAVGVSNTVDVDIFDTSKHVVIRFLENTPTDYKLPGLTNPEPTVRKISVGPKDLIVNSDIVDSVSVRMYYKDGIIFTLTKLPIRQAPNWDTVMSRMLQRSITS